MRDQVDELPAYALPVDEAAEQRIRADWPHPVSREWAWGDSTGAGVRVCIVDSGVDGSHPLVGGVILWTLAFVMRTGRDRPFRERLAEKREAKQREKEEAGKPTESLPLRLLGKGDPKVTFIVGIVLSFPGISYLDSLDHIHRLNAGTVATVLLVVSVCVIQLLFLERPLLGYVLSPERTRRAVTGFKDWMGRRGRTAAVIGATALGAWLIIRGLINLS